MPAKHIITQIFTLTVPAILRPLAQSGPNAPPTEEPTGFVLASETIAMLNIAMT